MLYIYVYIYIYIYIYIYYNIYIYIYILYSYFWSFFPHLFTKLYYYFMFNTLHLFMCFIKVIFVVWLVNFVAYIVKNISMDQLMIFLVCIFVVIHCHHLQLLLLSKYIFLSYSVLFVIVASQLCTSCQSLH